jgi:serine/threonine protein kinase
VAVVYRATDIRLKRPVAIKLLPPDVAYRTEVRQRFLREAETAAQLNHPNIVPIYSVDEREGLVFFVMALVEGESLATRLERGPLPVGEACRVLREVADALAYAHGRGVIHRDIKPDNILLDRESGRAMVTDFGIARAAEADSRLTLTGVLVGTPAYMSPEQILEEREIDGRSDLYSLGVVGYQMLTGELPFKASSPSAMMMKHMSEPAPPIHSLRPDLPPALAVAIDRALAKRPEDRWPDAAAFRDAVGGLAQAVPGGEREGTASSPRSTPSASPFPARSAPPPRAAPPPSLSPPPPQPSVHGAGRARERRQWYRDEMERFHARPIDERIVIFRRNLASTGVTIGILAVINLVTSPHFPWFLFPALGMGGAVARQWSSLWAEGVSWRRVFARRSLARPEPSPPPDPARAARLAAETAARTVPAEVLASPYGDAVVRAAANRLAIEEIVASLSKADRELLPDVRPTVNGLADRVASLAQVLHRLDRDVSSQSLTQLEARLAAVRAEPEDTVDRERRLALLERQHASLRELLERRVRLSARLESAGIALENLKLDLLKLRSSGLQAALDDVTSATVEARSLSREIAHVLEAAEEVRRL